MKIVDLLESVDVPQDIIDEYSYGSCMILALALHKIYGFQIMVQTEQDGDEVYISHAYVKAPDGKEIDIMGVQDIVDIFSKTVVAVSEEELIELMKNTNSINDIKNELNRAYKIIEKYLKHDIDERYKKKE